MNRIVGFTSVFLLVAAGAPGNADGQAHGWPIQPINEDHPLGATLGEFQDTDDARVYQHTGVDILTTPCENPCSPGDRNCVNPCNKPCSLPTDDATQPCVFVTVGGEVSDCPDNPTSWGSSTHIIERGPRSEKLRTYQYYHLAFQSFDADYINQCNVKGKVNTGAPIARVTRWTCDYNHLHYGAYEDDGFGGYRYLNPLRDIEPKPDAFAPQILDVGLAAHDPPTLRWSVQFEPNESACTVVAGKVDIVAHVIDRDDAGSNLPGVTNVGVYNLRWRACAQSSPQCAWNETHDFKQMPAKWGDDRPSSETQNQFSTAPPWISDFNECPPIVDGVATVNETFAVSTSHASSGWDTTNGSYPDGSYSVSVEASDVADNKTTRSVHVCVKNGGVCTTDLAIRDGTDDSGAVPYVGSGFRFSPHITVNGGKTHENQSVVLGKLNTIRVEVWNTGSCTLHTGDKYRVCFGWNSPSHKVLFPIASQRVECKTESVADDWPPETSRATTFNWRPDADEVPSGERVVVVWSDMESDPVQTSHSVVLDNNQAQRDITFVAAP